MLNGVFSKPLEGLLFSSTYTSVATDNGPLRPFFSPWSLIWNQKRKGLGVLQTTPYRPYKSNGVLCFLNLLTYKTQCNDSKLEKMERGNDCHQTLKLFFLTSKPRGPAAASIFEMISLAEHLDVNLVSRLTRP